MKNFLSCDWGTTSLRLRLADSNNGRVLFEEHSDQGIADTFNLWEQSGKPENEKVLFYLEVIRSLIKKMEGQVGQSLNGVKLIISGMASSSIGFIDIPYNPVPLAVDGSVIQTALILADSDFNHDVLVISGVKTSDDVMRGEETQLIGCIDPSAVVKNELFIFPGTHSKHIRVRDNKITGFNTYMTGELFDLLSQKSLLKGAVEKNDDLENDTDIEFFKKGVKEAVQTNFLNSIFKVRTNHLFNTCTKRENFNYLSGLLIGTEIKDLKTSNADKINLVCGLNLEIYYRTALHETGISNFKQYSAQWADAAAVRGQLKIGRAQKILI
jgi:2-dehydro-3-deoxygalactonokinase